MAERYLLRCAIAVYVLSLILPIEGRWFGGVFLFFFSLVGSVLMLGSGPSIFSLASLKGMHLLLILMMPFYNFMFACGVIRFKHASYRYFSLFNVLLYIGTVNAAFAVLTAASTDFEFYYVLIPWTAALFLLSSAIILRIRRHRALSQNGMEVTFQADEEREREVRRIETLRIQQAMREEKERGN